MPEVVYNSYVDYTRVDGTKTRYMCKRKFFIKTKPQGIPINEQQQQELMQRYNLGVPIKRLSKDYAVSPYYVHQIIVKYRPPLGNPGPAQVQNNEPDILPAVVGI